MPARDREESPSSREPRRILALGSAALSLLGLALLAYDVLTQVQRQAGWWAVVAGALGLLAAGLWSAIDEVPAERPPPRIVKTKAERAIESLPLTKAQRALAPSLIERLVRPVRESRHRGKIAAFALLVLTLQALIPLAYYFGDDAYDERFAWRMFSAVRMHQCDVTATEAADGLEREVPLAQTIHFAWITTFRRNREASIERYLAWRCEEEGVERARLTSTCITPEGERVPPIVREIECESGDIRREGGL